MHAAVLLLLLGAAPVETPPAETPPPPYADLLQAALTTAAAPWAEARAATLKPLIKGAQPVVLELELGGDGGLDSERLAVPSRVAAFDDLVRIFAIEAEPFPPPDAAALVDRRSLTCLARVELTAARGKPRLEVALACRDGDKPAFRVAAAATVSGRDPGARLFSGWLKESRGDLAGATAAYAEAVKAAPDWDLASRALGLALVQSKNVARAIPYLNVYVEARRGEPDAATYAREIERFKQLQAKRLAEANRVRDRLSAADIAIGIKKGYALLERCLGRARNERRLAEGVDTLLLTWAIRKDGTTHSARLEGPATLSLTEHGECLEQVVNSWRFPQYSAGSEITASRVPIKIRGSRPAPAATTAASSGAAAEPAPLDEPTFSQCERSPDELQSHIRARQGRIQACVLAERRRAPTVKLPDNLPIAFVIDADGPIRNVAVEHRAYRSGVLASCVGEALAGSLLPSGGADCPAEFALDLKQLAPRRP